MEPLKNFEANLKTRNNYDLFGCDSYESIPQKIKVND